MRDAVRIQIGLMLFWTVATVGAIAADRPLTAIAVAVLAVAVSSLEVGHAGR